MDEGLRTVFPSNSPLVVIGSVAWRDAICDYNQRRVPADLDVQMSHSQFEEYIAMFQAGIQHIAQITVPFSSGKMRAVKYLVNFHGHTRMEVEITDYFESAKSIVSAMGTRQSGLTFGTINFGNLEVHYPPATTLLVLKMSHLALPFSWRKTAIDVSDMLNYLGRSIRQIMTNPEEADPNAVAGDDLKELLRLRLRENVAVNYTLQKKDPNCIKSPIDHRISLKTAADLQLRLDWLASLEQHFSFSNCLHTADEGNSPLFSTPFLPLKISVAKFESFFVAAKRRVLIELVTLVATEYFLLSGRLDDALKSSADYSNAAIAEEAYLCALESLCTRCIAPIQLPDTSTNLNVENRIQDPEFRFWWERVSLYDGDKPKKEHAAIAQLLSQRRPFNDCFSSVSDMLLHSNWSYNDKILLPSMNEIANMGIAAIDPLVNMLFAEIPHIIDPPPLMEKIVEKYRAEVIQKAAPQSQIVLDVWKLIFERYISDHLSAVRLSVVCRDFNRILSTSNDSGKAVWNRLLNECWSPKTLTFYEQGPENTKRHPNFKFEAVWKARWKASKVEIYTCPHCQKPHSIYPRDDWYRKNGWEHTRNHCPCPDCYDVTGSWGNCAYHSLYIK